MELFRSGNVIENDDGAVENGSWRSMVFRIRNVGVRGGVEEEPDVVVVSMRVQSNLLFYFDTRRGQSLCLERSRRKDVRLDPPG